MSNRYPILYSGMEPRIQSGLATPHPTIAHVVIIDKWADELYCPSRALLVTNPAGEVAYAAAWSVTEEGMPEFPGYLIKLRDRYTLAGAQRLADTWAADPSGYLGGAPFLWEWLGCDLTAVRATADRLKQERTTNRLQEEARQEATRKVREQEHQQKLEKATADFVAGECIDARLFEELIKKHLPEGAVPIQTIGAMRKRLVSAGTTSCRIIAGKHPLAPGIYAAIHALHEVLTAPPLTAEEIDTCDRLFKLPVAEPKG